MPMLLVSGSYFGNYCSSENLRFCCTSCHNLTRAMALLILLSFKDGRIQTVVLGPELSIGDRFGKIFVLPAV